MTDAEKAKAAADAAESAKTPATNPAPKFMERFHKGTPEGKRPGLTDHPLANLQPTPAEAAAADVAAKKLEADEIEKKKKEAEAATNSTTTTATSAPPVEAKKEKRRVPAKGYQHPKETPLTKENIGEVVKSVMEAVKPTTPAAPELTLTEEEQRDIKVMEFMEKADPTRYKGLADRARKFIQEMQRLIDTDGFYTDQKDAEGNPIMSEKGQREVAALQKKHGYKWDESDFESAAEKMNLAPIEAKQEAQEKEIQRLRAENESAKLRPVIDGNARTSATEVITELDPTFAKVIGDDGRIDDAVAKEMIEADPVKAPFIIGAAAQAESFAVDATLLFNGKGVPEARANRIGQFCMDVEKAILANDPEKQLDEHGRRFVSREAYDKMKPNEQKAHWILGLEDILPLARAQFVKGAKSEIAAEEAKIEKVAATRGWKKGETNTQTSAPTEKKGKPTSPASGEGGPAGAAAGSKPGEATHGASNFLKRMHTGTQPAKPSLLTLPGR